MLGAKAGRKERPKKSRASEQDKDIENKKTIYILVFSSRSALEEDGISICAPAYSYATSNNIGPRLW